MQTAPLVVSCLGFYGVSTFVGYLNAKFCLYVLYIQPRISERIFNL